MASYEIGRLHTVDPNYFTEAFSSDDSTSKVSQFYELMNSVKDFLAMIVETENCFVNDLSSICAMFDKGSTAAFKEKHLRHHVQVLNTFVGRLCSVAFPQIFSDHFIHLYDASKFILSVLPQDIQEGLNSVLQSASEEVQRTAEIKDLSKCNKILILVLSVRDFFHFSNRKKKVEDESKSKRRLLRHNSDYFDAIHNCNLDIDFLYNALYKVSSNGMRCLKLIKVIFASALSSIEKFSQCALENPLEIEKVLKSLFSSFVNSMVELQKFLQESGALCEEAQKHVNISTSKETKEALKISSLGTEWAAKLDRWLQLHPEANLKPIPPLESREIGSPGRVRRRRYTMVTLSQNV